MNLFGKLRSLGLLGGVVLAGTVLASTLLMAMLANKVMSPSSVQTNTSASIALWQLKKDVQREAVPVTGKTKNLRPPPPGEHFH